MSKDRSHDSANIKHVSFDKHFTSTWNRTPEDPNLTWGAKGLLWYLLTREHNWVTHVWQLQKVYAGNKRGNSRDAVRGFLKELKDNEYVTYEKTQKADGKWEHSYTIYPMKITQFQIMFPETVKPGAVKPAPVKASIIPNNELPNNELRDISNDISMRPPPVSDPADASKKKSAKTKEPTISHGSHVKLTATQLKGLQDEHGVNKIKCYIDRVNDYCASKPKKYVDYAAAIRNFIRNENKDQPQQPVSQPASSNEIPKEILDAIAECKKMNYPIEFYREEDLVFIKPKNYSREGFDLKWRTVVHQFIEHLNVLKNEYDIYGD